MAEVMPGAVAPAVAPVADATPTPEPTAGQEVAPEGESQPEAKPERTFTQKEVDEIAAKRAAQAERRALKVARAEAERDHYKRLAEQHAPQPQQHGEPKSEDFKDYEQYLIAKATHALRQEQQKREQESAAQRQQSEGQERASKLRAKFEAAADEFPDIEEKVFGDVPFTQPMVAYFEDSDVGPKVAYHLANNLKEAQRIAQLSPAGQFRELVKLEAQITAPPTPTKAPAPIVPNGTQATVEKDPLKLSDKEFREWRARQKAQKR